PEEGPINCDGGAPAVPPPRSGRDARLTRDGGRNGEGRFRGGAKYDVGKQRHDQPIPRSDRSAPLQDVSHLQQINRVGGIESTPIVCPDAPTERDAFRLPDPISIIFPAKCQMIQFHFPLPALACPAFSES